MFASAIAITSSSPLNVDDENDVDVLIENDYNKK